MTRELSGREGKGLAWPVDGEGGRQKGERVATSARRFRVGSARHMEEGRYRTEQVYRTTKLPCTDSVR